MEPTEAAAFVPELQHCREQRCNPRHVEEECAARTGIATRVEGCLGQTTVRDRRSRKSGFHHEHTGAAKRIHHLIRLLLIVKIPGLLECPDRLLLHVGSLILFAKVETVEHEDTCHAQILVRFQFSFNIALQCEWKAAEGDQKGLARGRLEEVLRNVVRRIDTDNRPFES